MKLPGDAILVFRVSSSLQTAPSAMIEFRNDRKVYDQGGREVAALDGFSLMIERGEFVALTLAHVGQ